MRIRSTVIFSEGLIHDKRGKFEKGAADILEMLNTQSALADAQMEHIRCQADRSHSYTVGTNTSTRLCFSSPTDQTG